jgi:hypothetical protein
MMRLLDFGPSNHLVARMLPRQRTELNTEPNKHGYGEFAKHAHPEKKKRELRQRLTLT